MPRRSLSGRMTSTTPPGRVRFPTDNELAAGRGSGQNDRVV
jgi:hypothetical protein